MAIHYLEIVTNDVEGQIAKFEVAQGLTFGKPVAKLGNARTAELSAGGSVGVRAPMHSGEKPVARPYFLSGNIEEAVASLQKLGAEIAVPPMEIPGHGTIAVYFVEGIEFGLWQL